MNPRAIASCLLVVFVFAAAVLLTLLAPSSCAVAAAHRLPRPAPVLLGGGGDAGAWGSFGRSWSREGREELAVGAATARRLGQRESLDKPPSPKPHGMPGTAGPDPPPPPPPSDSE